MDILCLHQSADLYGSDRSFLQVVEYMKKSGKFDKITVLLPRTGVLVDYLNKLNVDVQFSDLSLLSKTYLLKFQWHKIIFPLLAFNRKREMVRKYDVLYANTAVILDFYALSPFITQRKIIHIREIPPKWLGKILSALIKLSGALVIFNSNSTRDSFVKFDNSLVIHNAFEGFKFDKQLFDTTPISVAPIKILLIGRINSWKGQEFVIRSIAKLANKNVTVRIVGSPAEGNENILTELKLLTEKLELTDQIEFVDFMDDPSSEYQNCDLLVVPSIKPEPFGRIAIEAMSIGKPVIAANHGGLPEIIEHGKNGFLFAPNDQDAFNHYLLKYLENRDLIEEHGKESRNIFMTKFSIEMLYKHLNEVF